MRFVHSRTFRGFDLSARNLASISVFIRQSKDLRMHRPVVVVNAFLRCSSLWCLQEKVEREERGGSGVIFFFLFYFDLILCIQLFCSSYILFCVVCLRIWG